MTQRPISTLATVFGILTIIGIFMPWHALSRELPNGGVEVVDFQNGLGKEFLGQWSMVLAGLGTATMAWFAIFKTNPAVSRSLLFMAAVGFAAAVGMQITDVLRVLPEGNTWHDGQLVAEGKAIGIYLTLFASVIACLTTAATFFSPRTGYKD
jgi:hypothetical protein